MTKRSCSIDGCDEPPKAKGWCNSHYSRWWRHGNPTAGGASRIEINRFIERAATHADPDCLIWPFGTMGEGYGIAYLGDQQTTAHRAVLVLATNSNPADMHAAHDPVTCHNRLCVNPNHLRWATPRENQLDRLHDGTSNRGQRHGMSKLTNEDVLAIYADQRLQRQIAAAHGISQVTVSNIKRGHRWGWLTGATT